MASGEANNPYMPPVWTNATAAPNRVRIAAQLADHAVERLAGVDRVEHDAVAAADVADRRELLGPALRVAGADVAVDDVDVVGRDVRVELPALLGVGADPADRVDEVRAVVAHVDAGDPDAARAQAEQLVPRG